MVMSTQSVPFLKESLVTEKKSDTPEPVEAPEVKPAAKPVAPAALAKAAASGDAGVHILLAQLQGHESNGDAAKVAEVKAALAELGYE